jgi:hypothetical protein
MWAYSRCNYKKAISNSADEQGWIDHMRNHFREDDEDIPPILHCWFTACPRSQQDNAFKSLGTESDTDDNLANFNEFLRHTLNHFQQDLSLSREDLRHDDIHMLLTAWLKNEVYDAYHSPQIPVKQDEPLPDDIFAYFERLLEQQGYDPTERDLNSYDAVEQRTRDT